MKESRGLTLSAINDITTRINSAQDLHGLLTVIMDTAREMLRSEASSLLLYDGESDELIFDIARGVRGKLLSRRRIPLGHGIAGICARDRAPIVVNDASCDERVMKSFDQEIDFVTRNLLAVPMLARNEMIGVLEVLNSSEGRDYSSQDIRQLVYLSNMAALAIQNRRLYEDLKIRAEELHCVYEISQKINLMEDFGEMLDAVLVTVEEVLGAARASIIVMDDKGKIEHFNMRGFALEERDAIIDPGKGIAGIVMRSGDPLIVRDIEKEFRLPPSAAGKYRTKSFICVPIKRDDRVIGIMSAADKKDGQPFDSFELKVLSTVAGQLGDAQARFLSRKRELEILAYRKDLETAAMIQMYSLPRIPSRIAGLEIAARYEACRDVGGDFYDLAYHSEDRVSLVIADVAGKGVPAALFMEYSKTLLAGQIPRHLDPVTTLTRVNAEMYAKSRSGLFVTAMIIQLERDMFRFRMASAGHNRQILFRRNFGAIELLSAKGAPLGAFEESEYLERMVDYSPGDLLLLFTDGVTEACDSSFAEFGEERLHDLVRSRQDASPSELIGAIFAAVHAFRNGMEPSDDVTMMAVRL